MTIVLDDILAKLDPKTRARVQSAQDVEVSKQSTPSIGLNMALRGGLPYGRQVLVWGNKSAGKSSFCLQMIAMAQKEGKTCAWIDAEASYDPKWAEELGVDSGYDPRSQDVKLCKQKHTTCSHLTTTKSVWIYACFAHPHRRNGSQVL